MADVVGAGGAGGDGLPQFGDHSVGGIGGRPHGRQIVGVGRQQGENVLHVSHGVELVDRLDGAQSAGAGVDGGTPQLVDPDPHPRELFDHGRTRDECEGLGRHDHDVGDAQHQRRTGDGGTDDDAQHGDDARACRQRPRRLTPPVEGVDALRDVGPRGGQDEDHRDVQGEGAFRRGL